jgi:UDP-glucose 4-epimerase
VLDEQEGSYHELINIGTGRGTSVLECIKEFSDSNDVAVKYKIGERRAGDVMKVWSSTAKAEALLKWSPKRTLGEICKSSFMWYQKSTTRS